MVNTAHFAQVVGTKHWQMLSSVGENACRLHVWKPLMSSHMLNQAVSTNLHPSLALYWLQL